MRRHNKPRNPYGAQWARLVGVTPTGERVPYRWEPRRDAEHTLRQARMQNQTDREYAELVLEPRMDW